MKVVIVPSVYVICRTVIDNLSFFWVHYNDLTATSLESWLS